MLSEHYQRVKRTIFINNQVRKYYGKKYHRSSSAGQSGGAQERLFINQSRASKSRLSKGEVRIEPSPETEIIII